MNKILRDNDWVIIRPQTDGPKLRFDSDEVQLRLKECVEVMIVEACKRIEEKVPEDGGWFKNFSACNSDTSELIEERLDFSLYVQRDETIEGNLILDLSMAEAEHPGAEWTVLLTCGRRHQVLEFLRSEECKERILKGIKRLKEQSEKSLSCPNTCDLPI